MNRKSLIDRSNFVINIPHEDDESSKSLAEEFDQDEKYLAENFEQDEKSLTEDGDWGEFFDMETDRVKDSQNESLTKKNWKINVVVKFDTNPASVIKFDEDSKSKRVIVTETPDGLQLLKGLPILSVDGQHVSNFDCFLLEEMLAGSPTPVVITFGSEPVEGEGSIDCNLGYGLSFDDHIAFLGQTSSTTYDEDIVTRKKGAYVSTLEVVQEESTEFKVLADDEIDDMPKELQPISVEGIHGDMSGWSKNCKERAKIITELLNTEKSYIEGLEKLNKEFLELYVPSLLKSLNVDISPFAREVESLIFLHLKIYENLCSAENLCTVFQKEFKFMKMYKSYIKTYEETFGKLKQASNKRAFKNIFKTGKERVAQNPLGYFNALGITIVQRPPRYILLLKELKKHTPTVHPKYQDLEKALLEIESICGDINEYQRQNEFRLIQVSKSIDCKTLCAHGVKQLVVPSRRLVREGEVGIKSVKSSRMSLRRRGDQAGLTLEMGRILMCNDILIVMYGRKNRVICIFEMAKTEVELCKEPIKPSNSNKQFDTVFQVILRNRSADEMEKALRENCKSISTQQHRKKTLGLSHSSTFSSVGESFNIYLSTQAEAVEWKDSIVKYSGV